MQLMALSAPVKAPEALLGSPSISGRVSFFFRRQFPSNFSLLHRPPVRHTLSLTLARRRNQNSSVGPSSSSSKKKKRNSFPKKTRDEADEEEDALELLFSQLEEDLKNDKLTLDDDDDDDDGEEDELSEEDLAKLERELGLALGIDIDDEEEEEEEENEEEAEEEAEEDLVDTEEEEMPVKLKNWQLRRLAMALKKGRRKTSIKSLAAELCLDRAVVLDLLREPPPRLLMLSASLPDPPTRSIPETRTLQATREEEEEEEEPVEVVTAEEVKVPVHVMQQSWAAQKRLKKVQVGTLERVYRRTKRPTNAMISSIVQVTNLPRKRIVKWFEDKRGEDGVPDQRLPYDRSAPKSA
ncbi:protein OVEREXPRESSOR OF CATIONIC PEROXIDASE 3 [Cucurbita pepo subsp. pepo]|uniref:protein OVEREXPRESSOR OF CATIONIC PEROXIDASE 3 n=1 Tax=Cucurbita pepo subsp. pepo TaxID=3664 RepID=UPI000C9D9A8D|nr:protein OVEREXPRESSOR OF CATIONIC PEROXIDASE 3 [Cucurbita pepo subsp. pepo]XP_023535383.1 protein OVEREXPRESSOR OF CATIONIC PEROXIDASE 3 [Cucurbita pepo subsp. pepo]